MYFQLRFYIYSRGRVALGGPGGGIKTHNIGVLCCPFQMPRGKELTPVHNTTPTFFFSLQRRRGVKSLSWINISMGGGVVDVSYIIARFYLKSTYIQRATFIIFVHKVWYWVAGSRAPVFQIYWNLLDQTRVARFRIRVLSSDPDPFLEIRINTQFYWLLLISQFGSGFFFIGRIPIWSLLTIESGPCFFL